MNHVLESVMRDYSYDDIANHLGLHKGTIKRWKDMNYIPANYHYDLHKMAGRPIPLEDKDQFYTKHETAKDCFKIFKKQLKKLKIDEQAYHFIEPSVGAGAFYNLLPEERRTGIDIDPAIGGVIIDDYISWVPPPPA